jgi:ABC-2 type transport system permease protein
VIPLSVVLTVSLQFAVNLVVVFAIIIATGVHPIWTWLLFPLLIAAVLILTTGVSLLLSALYVRLRDVSIIWTVLSTALFYATPVLYPVGALDGVFRTAVMLNPLTPIFNQAHEWVIDSSADGAVEAANGDWWLLVIPTVLFVAICAVGVWVFFREAPRVAEDL